MKTRSKKNIEITAPRKRYTEDDQEDFEILYNLYGKNKKLPEGYELQALIALSHFPELKDISIEFVFTDSSRPMYVQPAKRTFFRSARKRTYVVYLGEDGKPSMQHVQLHQLPFNAQVGALGHELAHIVDYTQTTSLGVLGTGAVYLLWFLRDRLESEIDRIAIKHGLGHQILAYANVIVQMQEKFPDETYFKTYFDYYLSPAEIRAKMRQLKMYERQ
jgi:hypothetical protein